MSSKVSKTKMQGIIGTSASSTEPRHRLFAASDDPNKKSPRMKEHRDTDKQWNGFCKFHSLKFVFFIIMVGTMLLLLRSPDTSVIKSGPTLMEQWNGAKPVVSNQRYKSDLEVNWDEISRAISKLQTKNEINGIALINFNHTENSKWANVLETSAQPEILQLSDYLPNNVTWESIYPEWIDETESYSLPSCPVLPEIHHDGNTLIDLIAVKLPCDRSQPNWSRNVARLHLQLAAARLAAKGKAYRPMRVLFVTECFPIPNLYTCKELLVREGNTWIYEPELNTLREKLQLPLGSCELALPFKPKDYSSSGNAHREAYATVLHSADIYVCGALAAAHSIRMSGSKRDLVILVDASISDNHTSVLKAAGWKVHIIERIRNPKAGKNAYNEYNYSKFRLWQLTDYDKIVFIDADLLILRNIDFLFRLPEISAIENNATLFNSGVMVIEPSNCTFQILIDHINDIESYNGGDQGYLNEIFTWWHRIPNHMNYLKNFYPGIEEERRKEKMSLFEADPPILYVIHYLGLKPWLCFRDYDCNWNIPNLRQFAVDSAFYWWWKVHDTMPEEFQRFCTLASVQKAQLEWDRREAEKTNLSGQHWKVKIKDPRLEICHEKDCKWWGMLNHWGKTPPAHPGIPVAGTDEEPSHSSSL